MKRMVLIVFCTAMLLWAAAFGGESEILIPEGTTEIGEAAFENCEGITAVVIPEGVRKLSQMAFSGCAELTEVYLPEGLHEICENSFAGCSRITDVWYAGSEAEWQAISIASGNNYLLNATIHYAHQDE